MSAIYRHLAIMGEDEAPFGVHAPKGLQNVVLGLARKPPFYRGILRRRMANLVRGFDDQGIVDMVFRGARFRLRSNGANLIEDGVLVHPHYNRVELDFLLAGTPEGGVFVDLGSNIGLYTLPLAIKAGPAGRVVAIDANPDIVPVLAFNAAASGLANITVANVAVGDEASRGRLEIRKDDLAIIEVAEDPEGEIEIRPLAEVLAEVGVTRVDTLKADIEGYEDRALLPWLKAAAAGNRPRRVVIEHLSRDVWKEDCFTVLERLGYAIAGHTRGNTLFLLKD